MDYIQISLSKTNCYLFRLNSGWMLFDCGYDRDRVMLDKKLNKAGIRYNDINWLFLSHHHDDHAGLINYLIERNPKLQVIMHALCAELIQTGTNQRYPGGGWASRGTKLVGEAYSRINKNWTLSFPAYQTRKSDVIIDDEKNDILSGLGLDAGILITPGHTPDSISMLDGEGNLFCGDAAANYLQWAGTRYSPLYISDLDRYYESWDRIVSAGVHRIFPAHGNPFSVRKLIRYRGKIKSLAEFVWKD